MCVEEGKVRQREKERACVLYSWGYMLLLDSVTRKCKSGCFVCFQIVSKSMLDGTHLLSFAPLHEIAKP